MANHQTGSSLKTAVPLLVLLSLAATASVALDCLTVSTYFSTCSIYIAFGSPDPLPGMPCCDSMIGLQQMANSGDSRRLVCACIMGLISSNNPNATAIATLPGFCGVSFGFTIDPNADCSLVI